MFALLARFGGKVQKFAMFDHKAEINSGEFFLVVKDLLLKDITYFLYFSELNGEVRF